MLALLFVLLFALPAQAIPVSYNFAGTLADGGTITGAFAYDTEAAAIATNVRGLSPNQVFGITSSAFTVAPVAFGLPTVQSTISEFCTGNCIFAGPLTTALTITGLNSNLRLSWDNGFASPMSSGWLRAIDPAVSPNPYLIGVTSGTLTRPRCLSQAPSR